MNHSAINISYALGLLLMFSCSGGNKLNNKNLAYIYYNDPTIIHPSYSMYHESDTISTLYFRFSSREALYSRKPRDTTYSAELSIHYRLFDLEDDKTIQDSATLHLLDYRVGDQQRYLSGKLNVRVQAGRNYYLELTLNDKIRDQAVQNYFSVEKADVHNRQNFLVEQEGKVAFQNHFRIREKVRIKCNHLALNRKVVVRYYDRYFKLPPPPFSSENVGTFEYESDSIFTIEQLADSSFEFEFTKKGFYHFQTDSSSRVGLTLYQFEGGFPLVREVDDMIDPIRYLTTRQEFTNFERKGRSKESIDEFWYAAAGGVDRGRAVVKTYYNRVQEANLFFTSYVEGWKTDRGLIYTIYGPPNVIYKTLDSENWIYGEQNNLLSVNFTFYRIENPFTDNDFFLGRSPVYKSSWYRAVDSWRQGRAVY
jgi:GWxTD domain-containing protein